MLVSSPVTRYLILVPALGELHEPVTQDASHAAVANATRHFGGIGQPRRGITLYSQDKMPPDGALKTRQPITIASLWRLEP
jgi:hypothetical protein